MSLEDSDVLIAHSDAFEAGYISGLLAARGVRLHGPYVSIDEALAAIAERPGMRAAVIAATIADLPCWPLVERLRDAGLPYLLLLREQDAIDLALVPHLAPPFAAWQVLDWLEATLAAQAESPRATRAGAATLDGHQGQRVYTVRSHKRQRGRADLPHSADRPSCTANRRPALIASDRSHAGLHDRRRR